jgi:hypothetical protein
LDKLVYANAEGRMRWTQEPSEAHFWAS